MFGELSYFQCLAMASAWWLIKLLAFSTKTATAAGYLLSAGSQQPRAAADQQPHTTLHVSACEV